MIYGLYLSATGVMTNSHRQDTIANNIANSETAGFKRNVSMFQQRLTEAQSRGKKDLTNPITDAIGGGFFASPTVTDLSQGDLEETSNKFDLAIQGQGYFAVDDHGKTRMTRDGRFRLNKSGELVMANGSGQRVLDEQKKPITLDGTDTGSIVFGADGQISQKSLFAGKIGVFDVSNPDELLKHGQDLFDYSGKMTPSTTSIVNSGYVERANVDPANELAQLMDAQRQLEANANMIRYQDQTLSRLVNDVAKV